MPDFSDAIDPVSGDAILAAHVAGVEDNTRFVREYGDVGHELGISTATGYHRFSIASPLKVTVGTGAVWSLGFWQASDNGWWLLGRQADVSSFTRAQANFYIPLNDIADVPSS